PMGQLSGTIRTNRGCQEDGDNPVFFVGEIALISFRVNSNVFAFKTVLIDDMLANGFTNTFLLGTLPTNVTFAFTGLVAPPTGTETLKLRVFGSGVLDTCTFLVQSGFPPTKTRTPTRTPMMNTPTPTSTPTPTT